MKIGMIRSLSNVDDQKLDAKETKYTIDTIVPLDEKLANEQLRPSFGALQTAFRCCSSYLSVFQRQFSTKVMTCRPEAFDSRKDVQDNRHIRLRFHFIAHFGSIYSKIRSVLKYAMKPMIEELASDEWSSTPTPGNSTALFFFCGSKWVVKTVTSTEMNFLSQKLLPEYLQHFAANPDTLLPHFLGSFTLIIKSGFGGLPQRLSFVLMRNMVPLPMSIHCEKYDLKGSLVDRCTSMKKPNRVHKDRDLKFKIHIVNEAVRRKLLDQCRADVDFLTNMSIMDYSLLLGVVRDDQNQNCEVVLGFVDILQTYNWRKRLERFFKSCVYYPSMISCAPPRAYGKRFLDFIESLFV